MRNLSDTVAGLERRIEMGCFEMPAHTFTGKCAIAEAMPHMRRFGNKALIVTGPHVGKSKMVEQLKEELEGGGIASEVFDGITGEPDDLMIQKGAQIYREMSAKFVIGIGGGSPIDSAKAIAVAAGAQEDITTYCGKDITGDIAPIVAIPTTAGTGSEATKFSVITDTENSVKMLLKGEGMLPKIAILNSIFTKDMPGRVTAFTGIDALTHAVEAFTSKQAGAFTDVFAVSAVKRIMANLVTAYKDGNDVKAREQMALAAYEAGVCINNSSVTLVHGMSRPLGAIFHVPHGMSNAMLLEECLEFALPNAYEKLAILAHEIGIRCKDEMVAAREFIGEISRLIRICEIPTPKEYGIDRDEFISAIPKMAEDAIASKSPSNTVRDVTSLDCEIIYKSVYK